MKTEVPNQPAYLWTAHVWAEAAGKRITCRILIDPGSQSSHVTHNLINRLGSKPDRFVDMAISTAGGRVTNVYNCGVHNIILRSRYNPSKVLKLEAIELRCLTRAEFPIFRGDLGLNPKADHAGDDESGMVDILIGSEEMANIEFADPRNIENLFAFNSMFGWVVGGLENPTQNTNALSGFCGFELIQPAIPIPNAEQQEAVETSDEPEISNKMKSLEDIKWLWQSDDAGFDDEAERREEDDELNRALRANFRATTTREPSGKYVIHLPFKDNVRNLGDNMKLSLSILHSLLNKLSKDPVKLKAVDQEVQNYIKQGFIEEAEPRRPGQLAHYLPVQAVFKPCPNTPLKLKTRVVKDASARTTDAASLNDTLHVGPSLLPNLIKAIMKFRQYRYAVTADIMKAFLQFKIAKEDRTFLRFFWPLGISEDPAARRKEFWGTRLDFGLVCSPSLHCQGVLLHLDNAKAKYPEHAEFLDEIANHFYMDDLCTGADTIKEAKRRITLMFEVFQDGNFPLKKWSSNSSALGAFIRDISPVADPEISTGVLDGKFLGVVWNQVSDTISAPVEKALKALQSGPPSKRRLLRGLASVYDPLNILSPTCVNARVLLQELWKAKCGWDIELSDELKSKYNGFIELLERTKSFSVERNLISNNATVVRQLHIFSDASLQAYGCVAYIRELRPNSEPKISFVMAKLKVAPVRPMSIHRIELLGSLLAARLLNLLKKNLDFKIDSYHLHCDNASVLGWVRSKPERWKAFVANRIRRIHALVGDAPFAYVKSEHNPADLISRPSSDISDPKQKELWAQGPCWLRSKETIPNIAGLEFQVDSSTATLDVERKPTISTCLVSGSTKANESPPLFSENYFSCWIKTIRFWAHMRRWTDRTRRTRLRKADPEAAETQALNFRTGKNIEADEMLEARNDLIKRIQRAYFPAEVRLQCKTLKTTSELYQYAPFMDSEGLIRCRSRLARSRYLTVGEKFPIILPSSGALTQLIVRNIHEQSCLHSGGVAAILHELRKNYLLLHARKIAREITRTCPTCKIFHNKSGSLPVADLPDFRIERAAPFENTGCDFAGPIRHKKDSGEIAKGYILLFTCAVTRLVHLELTTDLSTVEVLGALQKFINRFPLVKTITSDNGLSFKRASKEVRAIYEHIQDGAVKKMLSNNFIKWRFNTPSCSWAGGFFERMVQTVKRPLRKILGTAIPHFRDLEIILSGIEAMVNLRPITTVASGADEPLALSPLDLLYGHRGDTFLPQHSLIPNSRAEEGNAIFAKRYKYQQRLINAFWKRFRGEYLSYLKTAHKRPQAAVRPLEVGDICLLEDSASSRGLWPLCRVISFPENADPNTSRSCTIKTAKGQILNRPIKKLYPIEKSSQ